MNNIKRKIKCSEARSKGYDIICISYNNIMLTIIEIDKVIINKIMKFASSAAVFL